MITSLISIRFSSYFIHRLLLNGLLFQGQAVVQLAKTVKDVTIFGVCSKSKHEALKAAGTIDHLLERGTDYSNEIRKCVTSIICRFFSIGCFSIIEVRFIHRLYYLLLRRISSEGVDIVLDCLCGEECNKGYALLKPMGKYILYGSSNVVTGETKSFFSAARSVR